MYSQGLLVLKRVTPCIILFRTDNTNQQLWTTSASQNGAIMLGKFDKDSLLGIININNDKFALFQLSVLVAKAFQTLRVK